MSNSVFRQTTVPEPVSRIAELMSGFRAPWALCGGWAVDAWLGGQSRDHGDVDIAVFVEDQQTLFDHLGDWQLVAHDAATSDDTAEAWDGRPLVLPGHIHARPDAGERLPDRVDAASDQRFGLDIQLGDRSGREWVLWPEPRLGLPLQTAVGESPWGLPTAAPEVLLFFKAQELRRRDRLDFQALLPQLTREQRDWIREAVSVLGHPWLSQLTPR